MSRLGNSARKAGQGIGGSAEEKKVFKMLEETISEVFRDEIKNSNNITEAITKIFYKYYEDMAQLGHYKDIPYSVRAYFQRRYGN